MMYYLIFHAVPNEDALETKSAGGAFVSCWIKRGSQAEAVAIARQLIEGRQWRIEKLEEAKPISREDYNDGDDGLQYFEQAAIDEEVLVFYNYPRDDGGLAIDKPETGN